MASYGTEIYCRQLSKTHLMYITSRSTVLLPAYFILLLPLCICCNLLLSKFHSDQSPVSQEEKFQISLDLPGWLSLLFVEIIAVVVEGGGLFFVLQQDPFML